VEGLYLQGSVALGDYRPKVSDIDFVAVTGGPVDLDTLRQIHRAGLPRFEGLYVGWDDLRRDPARSPAGLAVHGRRVHDNSRFERHLVTWHVLAQGGVAVRGPATSTVDIFTDWPRLALSTVDNLEEYWRPWARRAAGVLGLTGWAVSWGVLGVARLRHSLAAGRVTSKTAAAGFAIDAYGPRWRPIVEEALRIRVGGPARYRDPFRRRADLLAFLAEAIGPDRP
jgi:hypothetical protein